jgi:hypothetical protein
MPESLPVIMWKKKELRDLAGVSSHADVPESVAVDVRETDPQGIASHPRSLDLASGHIVVKPPARFRFART